MARTYVSELVHCVFSTKERRKSISPETQPDLWSFIGGVARKNGFKALIVGGTEDHVHILLSLPAATCSQGDAIVEGRLVSMDERDSHQGIYLAGRVMARSLWRNFSRS